MDWFEIKIDFLKKFSDYSVYVIPSCISENREQEYRVMAMAAALGYKTNDRVSIDHKKKRVYYFR